MGNASKILVIDDDAEIGIMLKLILEHNGYQVISLQRSEPAEEVIGQNTICLIILDMLIAGVRGNDVCQRLKENNDTSHIPIMMMTALPEAELICKQAGADDFISKPFEMDTLLSKVGHLINTIPIKKFS